ncbi:HD family phosphohydrolase [Clostridium acetireducens]|uniref:HD family phosphohydrolase n=1 Tax=Clostridium acetireducens TaxID=76489 RepID=UPI00087234A2|nr:HD family phosphohydrolase [Clostridium acetireducens]
MKKTIIKDFIKEQRTKRIITFILIFIFIYSVIITSIVTKKYNIKEGDIAKIDIKAPREVKDEIATNTRIQQSVETVPIQYNKKIEIKTDVIRNINEFFTKIDEIKNFNISKKEKIQKLKNENYIKLPDDDYIELINLDKENLKLLQNFLVKTMSELYDNNNISDNSQSSNLEDVKKAQESIMLSVNTSGLPKYLRELALNIGYSQIKPNFFYDKEKTEELRQEAMKKAPVMIKKDQIIVKEGEPVTKSQIEVLKSLGLLNSNESSEWYIYFSLACFVLLVMSLQWMYLYRSYKDVYNDIGKLILIGVITGISLVLARIFNIISPFLIPLACTPMLGTLLINDKISLNISLINCILISSAVGFNVEITILAILNTIIGANILKKMQQRNDILYSSIYIALINIILIFSSGFLLTNNVLDIAKKGAFAFTGSIMSGIFTIGFLPFFENAFDIVTTVKLLELSNPNNPLLKKLLMEAPGTYHHSILVGNLAEVAADEVGGNSVLARVSSYYHDIGKVKRPYFFKENQMGSENPHNKITPNLSTLIITSHVKDGVELAKEYKIPKVVIDVIQQHHGTSLVKYFYITMKNSAERPEDIREDDFKYPGPVPSTKEAAIVMLADGVEAAVRSINSPTKGKIEEMVNNIIKSRLDEGQLDNCDLTLKDINKIRKAFLKVLNGIYHQRIEYPEDKWNNKKRKEDKK